MDYGPEDEAGRLINSIHTPPVNQQSQVIIFKVTTTCSREKLAPLKEAVIFMLRQGVKSLVFLELKIRFFDPSD